MKQTEQLIREFIVRELMFGDDESVLGVDQPLLGGAIDSMDLQRLLLFIEEEFDVSITDDLLLRENFQDVRAVSGLVEKLRG